VIRGSEKGIQFIGKRKPFAAGIESCLELVRGTSRVEIDDNGGALPCAEDGALARRRRDCNSPLEVEQSVTLPSDVWITCVLQRAC
jgi:hypothetical protein